MKKFLFWICVTCSIFGGSLQALEIISTMSSVVPKMLPGGDSDEEVNLEKLTAYSFDDTNNGAPVKIHLILVFNGKYATEAKSELDQLTATEYSERIEELKKKYPDTMRGASWEIMAKKAVHPLSLQGKDGKKITECGHMIVVKAYVFVEHYPCSKSKPQMAVIPSPSNVGIYLDRDSFTLKSQEEVQKMVKEKTEKEAKSPDENSGGLSDMLKKGAESLGADAGELGNMVKDGLDKAKSFGKTAEGLDKVVKRPPRKSRS